ncbi:ATP-dependent RNA helicase SUPV3L1, mitochondrial-like [Asterias amurensis]|uniref:ATP-dependent RNA helicase SUPV3L1, mitochondrial-like n=1 Tax=Asterias amurensis TaxID=7602 RepID=UPI003AB71B5F
MNMTKTRCLCLFTKGILNLRRGQIFCRWDGHDGLFTSTRHVPEAISDRPPPSTSTRNNWTRTAADKNKRKCAPPPLFSISKPLNIQCCHSNCRHYSNSNNGNDKNDKNISTLFIPVPVKMTFNPDDINIGEELGASLKDKKAELLQVLNLFYRRKEIQRLAAESGLDEHLFHQAFVSFRKYIVEVEALEPDLHIILSDILAEAGHVDDIFPYFLRHARQVFPALDCMEDLKKISDLTDPAQWYGDARDIKRKIVFHAGPTNSGKTYHALERFCNAKSGVYCGPLKLLASEVHMKTNDKGIMCDLVTGEERRYSNPEGTPSSHLACTVEMTSVNQPYEVAVIDEIQMLRDPSRGWAWTRAFLGLTAQEIHLCGEEAAIDLVQQLTASTGDEMEIRRYKRLTSLKILDEPLGSLENTRPGDCIVAFNKNDLYSISRQLEAMGKECAVIYGSLPPGTKLSQAKKFNDPDDPCKIMVATDAIGMGLNLSIKRVIFNSLIRPIINEKGEKEMDRLSTSQALQIAGRAGRFGTQFQEGEATTFHASDLITLKDILSHSVESIEAAGLHPTAEQIELFAYHLPEATLSNLIDIFVTLSKVDSNYFVCNVDDFKFLADMIQHIPLHLRARYVFCCAPINKKHPFISTMFLKFARQYSRNEPMTYDWFCRQVGWPLSIPKNIRDLMHLEAVHDVMDLYLWLSYRFMDMFPDTLIIRDIQRELDDIIHQGVDNITKLIRATEIRSANGVSSLPDDEITRKKRLGKSADSGKKSRSKPSRDSLKSLKDESDIQNHELDQTKLKTISGRLSKELIKQGLLSQDVLDQLHQEWLNTGTKGGSKGNGRTRKKKK